MKTSKRWRWRAGGLHWRIMISYFLVTLVAALTIEFAVTLGSFVQDLQLPMQPIDQVLNQRQERAASQIVPLLEQTVPDKASLQSWLLGTFLDSISTAGSGEPTFVVIVDQHRQSLAAASCESSKSFSQQIAGAGTGFCTSISGDQAAVLLSPSYTQAAIGAALEGVRRPVEVAAPQKHTIIAVSVIASNGQVLGALVSDVMMGTDTPTAVSAIDTRNLGELLLLFFHNLQPAAFYFVLLATAIGTVTGILISGGITRRLRRITQATAAWSRGEFRVSVFDPSRDEVGQLTHDLNRMAAQLQTLLPARQELAVLQERTRLARELHDSVKQHVFANALLIRAARKVFTRDPDKAQAYLEEAETLADQAQQELVGLIQALRPAAIADKGLAVALQDYVSDWERRMGVVVKLQMQAARAAPLDLEDALFRVVQEALANVARHSNAQEVDIFLVWDQEQVQLIIHDNGKGFDTMRSAGKGIGLRSMRERVEALQGTLAVTSSEAGTTIEAFVPLPTAAVESAEVAHE